MSIEPVAWMDVDTKKLELSYRDLADFERAVKIEALYPQSAIDELQRQLAEAQEVGCNLSSTWKSTEDKLQRQLAEAKAINDSEFGSGWEDFDRVENMQLKCQLAESKENERLLHQACADYEQEVPDLERQLAEEKDKSKQLRKLAYNVEKCCCEIDSEGDELIRLCQLHLEEFNKRYERKFAEREAVIERKQSLLKEIEDAWFKADWGYNINIRPKVQTELATPTDHTALREICLKVASEFCDYGHRYDIEAIVDRVLGEVNG